MGIRITDLASTSVVGLTDTLVLVQGGNTKKCDVSQVKTLSASELVTGTLEVARLPVVPVSLGGTGAVNATSALAALGAQPALTSDAPASLAQGGTGATTAVAALNALGGITSDAVPSLVTAQLSAYALTSQLAPFQNSAQVQALTTAQLSAITFTAGTGLTGGGSLDQSRTIALETSGVSAGTFGSAVTVGQFTVDSKGRITSATDVGISGSAGGTVVSVGATSSTLAISNSPVTYSGAFQLELSTTGVPAITVGSSTQSAVITVDAYGRVTALSSEAIVSLTPTGVVSGAYGHPDRVARFTVDANGILTAATEASIAISAAAVSGLAASATSDTTNAGNIITGTLSSARISVLASSQISGISAAQVGVGITSAQVNGLAASQISGSITSAQIAGISAAQVGAGITSAQLSAITGTGAVVLASSPTIATPAINGYTEGTVAQGTVGAAATLAITSGTVITATLTSATPCTFTMPAVGAGKSFALYLRQPSAGTPTTATFTGVRWSSSTAPTITALLGKMDILSFTSDGVNWYGSFIQNFTY